MDMLSRNLSRKGLSSRLVLLIAEQTSLKSSVKINKHHFPFVAHYSHFRGRGMMNSITMETHSDCTWCTCRRTFTSSASTLTQPSHLHTTSHNFPDSHRGEMKCSPCIPRLNLSTMQHRYMVREKMLSCFKEEWTRILRECEVDEPHWSVKWIVEHVLRKDPHGEVRAST